MGENALGIGARPGLLTRASRRILSWQARQIPAIEYLPRVGRTPLWPLSWLLLAHQSTILIC